MDQQKRPIHILGSVKRGIQYLGLGALLSAAPATNCITIESGDEGSSGNTRDGGRSSGGGGGGSLDSELFGFWARTGEGLFFSSGGTAYYSVENDCDYESRWRYATPGGIISMDFMDGKDELPHHVEAEYGSPQNGVLSLNFWDLGSGWLDYYKSDLCQESDLRLE